MCTKELSLLVISKFGVIAFSISIAKSCHGDSLFSLVKNLLSMNYSIVYCHASIMAFASSTGMWEKGKDVMNVDFIFIEALIG